MLWIPQCLWKEWAIAHRYLGLILNWCPNLSKGHCIRETAIPQWFHVLTHRTNGNIESHENMFWTLSQFSVNCPLIEIMKIGDWSIWVRYLNWRTLRLLKWGDCQLWGLQWSLESLRLILRGDWSVWGLHLPDYSTLYLSTMVCTDFWDMCKFTDAGLWGRREMYKTFCHLF